MVKGSLRTVGTGFGWLALMLAAASIEAQETNTVGNPQLKDFELPGTRTTPPAQQQPPATTTPPPASVPPATIPPTTAPPPTILVPPAQGPAAPPPQTTRPNAAEAPARRPQAAPRVTPPPPAATEAPGEVPAGIPAPAELEQSLPAPVTAAPEAGAPAVAPATPAEPEAPFPWLYVGLGLLLALLAAAGFYFAKRSRASAEDAHEEAAAPAAEAVPQGPAQPDPLFARRTAPKPAPAPAPVPARAPAAAPAPTPAPTPASASPADGIVSLAMRPRLELEFRADRAAATLTETSVQFELTIRNSGNRTARDIRIQVDMMNAGAEHEREIGAFFAAALDKAEPPVFAALAPKAEVHMRSGVTLPNDRLREITIQGRRLFIPVVAFNVYYEWEDGRTGQTSMSYLVGRQAPTPQEKMGAFRLDLGPRLYRSVGQRQGNLAKVV